MMKFHSSSWFASLRNFLLYGLVLNLLCESHSWTLWPNNFHPHYYHQQQHHAKAMPWIDPTFNHHPPFYQHPPLPEQFHSMSFPYQEQNSKNNLANYDYLSPASSERKITNNPSQNQSITAFKVSNPIVRHISTKNKDQKGKLMLYQAPPSYDRIMDPPPSILITSRPFIVTTTTEKHSDFVTGEVKLASSPQVQFSPQQNIAVDGYNGNWNTGVTLQVSLRPGSWTKSKRPTISEQMKQFLPELKYYKKGLKAVDMNKIKNKVEKYVLVSKKEPEVSLSTQPSISVMANDLLVHPQQIDQESTKEIKLTDEWDSSSEEEEFIRHEEPTLDKIEMIGSTTDFPSLNLNSTKMPSKSIEDIVAEVFATVNTSSLNEEDESDEKRASQHVKGLSNLFDMIYSNNVSSNNEDKPEPRKRGQFNTTIQLITAPPDVLPLPKLENTFTIGYKNNIDKNNGGGESPEDVATKAPQQTTTTATEKQFTEEVTIRCQGMWCHHSTTQSQPEALKSQQDWAKAGNEINPHDDVVRYVDPLLSYLGLAWPQHDRQSKTIESTQATNPTILHIPTTTTTAQSTHKMGVTQELSSSSSLPVAYFRDNDIVSLKPVTNNRPNYKDELKDSKRNSGDDINALASPVTQVSREHLEAMFNALGHGFGQVMSIIMPLALPIQKENDLSESSALNLDFNSFFQV